MTQSKKTIFVCDDNPDATELIRFAFKLNGYEVISCDNLEDCLSGARRNNFEAIILDNRFGHVSSLEVSRQIRNFNPEIPIIFYSAEARTSEIEKALASGANAYLVKPMGFDKLTETVIGCIDKTRK